MPHIFFIKIISSLVVTAFAQGIFQQDLLNLFDGLKNENPDIIKVYQLIKIPDAWDRIGTLPNLTPVEIGIADTGIDVRHPEFNGISVFNAISTEIGQPQIENLDSFLGGHGTQVAGIIGANNISFPNPNNYIFPQMNGMVSGVKNLNYSIFSQRVLTPGLFDRSITNFFITKVDFYKSLENLASFKPDVINISFGAPKCSFLIFLEKPLLRWPALSRQLIVYNFGGKI